MTNAVEGDLLNVGRYVLEVSVDEGTLSVDGICGRVHHQLERLRLHRQGWRSQKTIKIKTVEIRIEAFMELILPATVASDSASRAQTALASSSAALKVAWKNPR